SVRLEGLFLARRDSSGLFAAHAVLREQLDASGPRQGRRRLEHKRLVAGAIAIDRMGRELAQEPSLQRGFRAARSALVAGGHRLVFYFRYGIARSCKQHQAASKSIEFLSPCAPRGARCVGGGSRGG